MLTVALICRGTMLMMTTTTAYNLNGNKTFNSLKRLTMYHKVIHHVLSKSATAERETSIYSPRDLFAMAIEGKKRRKDLEEIFFYKLHVWHIIYMINIGQFSKLGQWHNITRDRS